MNNLIPTGAHCVMRVEISLNRSAVKRSLSFVMSVMILFTISVVRSLPALSRSELSLMTIGAMSLIRELRSRSLN